MPILEFSCTNCSYLTEKLYLTFSESDKVKHIECPECGSKAPRIVSIPGAPILLGDGFYKPAASGRTHTKGSDATKVTKEFFNQTGGSKEIIKQARGR